MPSLLSSICLCTSCQWNALLRQLGACSTVHDRFQEWQKAGVFEQLWTTGLLEYNTDIGLDLSGSPSTDASPKRPGRGGY